MKQPPACAKAQESVPPLAFGCSPAERPCRPGGGSFESDPLAILAACTSGNRPGVLPQTSEQAQAVLRFSIPNRSTTQLRGAAHSPSGEVLQRGGAVVATSAATTVGARTPATRKCTCQVARHGRALRPAGHRSCRRGSRPTTRIQRWLAPLSVGGFGDFRTAWPVNRRRPCRHAAAADWRPVSCRAARMSCCSMRWPAMVSWACWPT